MSYYSHLLLYLSHYHTYYLENEDITTEGRLDNITDPPQDFSSSSLTEIFAKPKAFYGKNPLLTGENKIFEFLYFLFFFLFYRFNFLFFLCATSNKYFYIFWFSLFPSFSASWRRSWRGSTDVRTYGWFREIWVE